jgi:hypothetical protein
MPFAPSLLLSHSSKLLPTLSYAILFAGGSLWGGLIRPACADTGGRLEPVRPLVGSNVARNTLEVRWLSDKPTQAEAPPQGKWGFFTDSVPSAGPEGGGPQRSHGNSHGNSQARFQVLDTWNREQLAGLKTVRSREREAWNRVMEKEFNPSGKSRVGLPEWKGVLLQTLLEKSLAKMPVESRAQFDLIILTSREGNQAMIPRSLVTKFPILIAFERNGLVLSDKTQPRGPFYSVIPWNSRPKIAAEALPLATYFLPDVVRIDIANYRQIYGDFFLKRRTEPSAMRGEKLFVQNCMSCHGTGIGPSMSQVPIEARLKALGSERHTGIPGMARWSERDQRSLMSYWEIYRGENATLNGSLTTPLNGSGAPRDSGSLAPNGTGELSPGGAPSGQTQKAPGAGGYVRTSKPVS